MVRAIRGAITVENNDMTEIIDATKELLSAIIHENNIVQDDAISIVFTVTNDLNAAFPAVAARQIGWTQVSLLCTNEIDVPGSLKKCIRILMHVNSQKTNSQMRHVYMKGAKILRPDLDN